MKSSPKLRPVAWDGLVVLLVVLLAAASALWVWRGGGETSGALTVVVTADGAEVDRFALADGETEKTYTSRGYTLHLLATDGGVQVSEADCPTQDCVHTGTIERGGQSIVCLPARVIIRLEGGGDADPDLPDVVIG